MKNNQVSDFLLKKAESIAFTIESEVDKLNSLLSCCNSYIKIGKKKKALEILNSAIECFDKIPVKSIKSNSLLHCAKIVSAINNCGMKQKVICLTKNCINEKTDELPQQKHFNYANIFSLLGMTEECMGQIEILFEQGRKDKYISLVSSYIPGCAEIVLEIENKNKAVEFLDSILSDIKKYSDEYILKGIINGLVLISKKTKDFSLLEKAINIALNENQFDYFSWVFRCTFNEIIELISKSQQRKICDFMKWVISEDRISQDEVGYLDNRCGDLGSYLTIYNKGILLNNAAEIFSKLGGKGKAMNYLREAVSAINTLKNKFKEDMEECNEKNKGRKKDSIFYLMIRCLNAIKVLGYPECIDLINTILEMCEGLYPVQLQAEATIACAEAFGRLGNREAAIRTAKKAIHGARFIDYDVLKIKKLSDYAFILYNLGCEEESLQVLEEAGFIRINIFHLDKDGIDADIAESEAIIVEDQMEAYVAVARSYFKINKKDLAIHYIDRAIDKMKKRVAVTKLVELADELYKK